MDDLSVLQPLAHVDASPTSTLMVLLPDGSVTQLPTVSSARLLDKCPLLSHAFELRETGDVEQASIEATSFSAVTSLLGFLYTGTYLADPGDCLGLLLPHVEAFKIAEDFDLPDFKVQAYVNFIRETEFCFCKKLPPTDLCETVRFIYHHFAGSTSQQHRSLFDTMLNYCVSVFGYQALGHRTDFRSTVFEHPDFHRDLCRTSMNRNFEDDGANDIVRLPVCQPTPHSQAPLFKHALGDFQYEMWQSEANDITPGCAPTPNRKQSHEGFTFVRMPWTLDRGATSPESETADESESERNGNGGADSSSDECGFTLVERPKTKRPPLISNLFPTPGDGCSNWNANLNLPILTKKEWMERAIGGTSTPDGPVSDDGWDLVEAATSDM